MTAFEYLSVLSETAFLNGLRRTAARALRLDANLASVLLRDLSADLDPESLVSEAQRDHFAEAQPEACVLAA